MKELKKKLKDEMIRDRNSSWPSSYRLPWGIQFLAGILNIFLGVIPGLLLFFLWVERNCRLPRMQDTLKWPLVDLSQSNLFFKFMWNISLFFLFGFLHSALAQKSIQKQLEKALPPQLIRTFYICVTGVSLMMMMANWQSTGIVLWHLPEIGFGLSSFIFWTPMLYCGHLLTRFGILEFIGIRQHSLAVKEIRRTEGTPQLIISGMYRWVRHPVYSCTLLAFIVSPEMTLDRGIVILATLLYLIFAIPIEEKKLIHQFGHDYLEYKSRIPAIFPFLI